MKAPLLESKVVNGGIILLMVIVLFVAGYASWKQYERHSRIKKEVAVLETEKERVRKENESLKERINYVATEDFQEQQSKEHLNMRKDDEFVVDIERMPGQPSKTTSVAQTSGEETVTLPNYKKWWKKFLNI